jgi:hypothetical protein
LRDDRAHRRNTGLRHAIIARNADSLSCASTRVGDDGGFSNSEVSFDLKNGKKESFPNSVLRVWKKEAGQ